MRVSSRGLAVTAATAVVFTPLAGCAASSGAGGRAITVTATGSSCEVAKTRLSAGTHTLAVTNEGSKVTEVYVYAPGDTVVTESENIGPGTTARVTVQLDQGKYQVACKPGMRGHGIRQRITVGGGTGRTPVDPRLDKAVERYRAYVNRQVDHTIAKTSRFVAAVKEGDVARAKDLYAPSRVGWERIEPVAESFGDIDPKVDARARDVGSGSTWTGWHRIEKALWREDSTKGMTRYSDRLAADLKDLRHRIPKARITPTSMANGAKELLDEVATSKITGEEETYSHTDLVDMAANVAGAKKVYTLLRPVVADKDPALAKTLDEEFEDMRALLGRYETADGFVAYDTVGRDERQRLSDAVNALAQPLSRLAVTVVS
ncbi:MAG: iron uptake system protein EfeO [Streptosporangiaceae bacterium]